MREYVNKLGMERVRSKSEKVIAQWRRNHRCVGCWRTPTKHSSMNLTVTCAFHPPICAEKYSGDRIHRWDTRMTCFIYTHAIAGNVEGYLVLRTLPSPVRGTGVVALYTRLEYAFPSRFETLRNLVTLSPTYLFAQNL